MAENKNLKLWGLVEKSDPASIKEVGFGGRKFHSIDAHSQIKKATEVLGIYGADWGVKDEYFEMFYSYLLKYSATLWYKYDGKEGEFPIASAIPAVYVGGKKDGQPDDECIKKVATDALTKGLSKLGFNSDVFENKFSDNKYVEQRMAETTSAKDEAKAEADAKKVATLSKKISALADKGDVDGITKIWSANINLQQNEDFVNAVRVNGAKARENQTKTDE